MDKKEKLVKQNQTLFPKTITQAPKPEPAPIKTVPKIKKPIIPEHPNYKISKIHHFFVSNWNYKKPLTYWYISRYNSIYGDSEQKVLQNVIELMKIVMEHYKDIEQYMVKDQVAYRLITKPDDIEENNPFHMEMK